VQQPTRALIAVVALAGLFVTGLTDQGRVSAQDAPLLMNVELIVPATIDGDKQQAYTNLCVVLPDAATTVTVGRRALVPEAGVDRPLWMTIRPYASTAYPLLERTNISSATATTYTLPGLGDETCFFFENTVAQQQAASVAQSYKYFAQIVTLEVR
jgi:hypothetical protein